MLVYSAPRPLFSYLIALTLRLQDPQTLCYTVAMKKSLSIGLAMLATILLIFVVAFVALQQVITNETFVNNQFTKLEIADSMNMNMADLVSSMMVLVHYMEGDVDSIDIIVSVNGQKVPMFELEQEITHMADVRDIYQAVRGYRDMAAIALLVLLILAALINFRRAPQSLAQGFLFGFFVMLVIFGFIGTWAYMDFSSFWTFFHEALFWNDLWLFDAAESRMINMLPEQMFADIIGRVGLYTGIVIGALLLLSILALVFSSERYKQASVTAKMDRAQRKEYRKNRAALLEERRNEAAEAKRLAEMRAAKRKAAEKAERDQIIAERAKADAKKARQKAVAKKKKAAKHKTVVRQQPSRSAAPIKRQSEPAPSRQQSNAAPVRPQGNTAPIRRQGDAAPIQAQPTAEPVQAPPAAPAKKQKAAMPKLGKAKKPRGNVVDDTGFLDE